MAALRQMAAGALWFSSLFLTLPQAHAIRTGTQQSQTLGASLQQRVSLAQQEMQTNALALAVYEVGSGLKEEIINGVKEVVVHFSKELVRDFRPRFHDTCERVVQEAASHAGSHFENEGQFDSAASALAQIEEALSARETCDVSSPVTFKPTGAITGSFLEGRGFWDTLKQSASAIATPMLAQIKRALTQKLARMLEKEVAPQLEEEVAQALNDACSRAIYDAGQTADHGMYGEEYPETSQEGR